MLIHVGCAPTTVVEQRGQRELQVIRGRHSALLNDPYKSQRHNQRQNTKYSQRQRTKTMTKRKTTKEKEQKERLRVRGKGGN
jgi:hypothetical protein